MNINYYKPDSIPLQILQEDDIHIGDLVYNELGRCLQKIQIKNKYYFIEKHDSVLQEGELMQDLTFLQLTLFWTLSNKLNI